LPRSATSQNRIYNLLFELVAETVRTIAADPKHLVAQIGVTLVSRAWGSAVTRCTKTSFA
jgi:hypothetical protein